MKRIAFTIVASMALVSAYAMSGAAQGAERPNVLIMGEDIDRDSIRRGSQAFNRTLNAIATEMQKVGYKVYDETAITLEEFKQGRIFRRNDELIDIAKSVREAPIDVVVIFSIFPEIDRRRHTTRLFASVTGRMVDVNNGRRLGNFTEKPASSATLRPIAAANAWSGISAPFRKSSARKWAASCRSTWRRQPASPAPFIPKGLTGVGTGLLAQVKEHISSARGMA